MKKTTIYALTAAALLSLAGCQDEAFVEQPGTPVQEGEEIVFGSALPDVATHRTVYGTPDVENQVYPVYWEYDANDASVRDHVKIYCLQAAQEKLVEYIVQPGKANSSTSQQLERVGDCGLQWSDAPTHNFYGFYPAASVKGTETDGRILSDIPATQYALDWENTPESDGSTTWRAATNTDYAAMVAYTSVETDKMTQGAPIPLSFKPLTTILEIVVNGPLNTGNTESVTVTNINVRAAQGSAICGPYYCNILAKDGQTGELDLDCEPADNPEGESRNNISIPTYNLETGKNIVLKRGDKMVVHAFLVPTTDEPIDGENVSITVGTDAGSNTKTLTGFTIQPHKVNRIVLPALSPQVKNNWLSSLDPNTYLSELSIPGSIHSALSEANQSSIHWQETNLEQQFTDGVRAFAIQTGAKNDGGWAGVLGSDPEWRLAVAVDGSASNRDNLRDLRTILKRIADEVKAANAEEAAKGRTGNEFAFVQLSFSSAATDHNWTSPTGLYYDLNDDGSGRKQVWMASIENCIKQYAADDELCIFQGPITSTTTLSDVAGTVILKVNVNDESQDDNMCSLMSANAGVPALFSDWENAHPANGVPLTWGSSNPSVQAQSPMTWFYQEVTTIGPDRGCQVPNLETKQGYIANLFQKSVDFYLAAGSGQPSNYFFMNDVSGCVLEAGEGSSPTNTGIERGIQSMNEFIVDQMAQRREQNAALGLVYMSFANRTGTIGQTYNCGELIQTIIDNNFRFNLRRKPTGTPAQQYNATYQNGGDAISH